VIFPTIGEGDQTKIIHMVILNEVVMEKNLVNLTKKGRLSGPDGISIQRIVELGKDIKGMLLGSNHQSEKRRRKPTSSSIFRAVEESKFRGGRGGTIVTGAGKTQEGLFRGLPVKAPGPEQQIGE